MIRFFLSVVGCSLLVGCSMFDPIVDARREAGFKEPAGHARPEAPAICYGLRGGRTVADSLAQAECDKQNKKAIFQNESVFSCTLLTPTRAYYRCE